MIETSGNPRILFQLDPVDTDLGHVVERQVVEYENDLGELVPCGRVRCRACGRTRFIHTGGTAGLAGIAIEYALLAPALTLHTCGCSGIHITSG